MAFGTGCATTKPSDEFVQAAIQKEIAKQATLERERFNRAADIVRASAQVLPAKCGARVLARISKQDKTDPRRVAVKYQAALVAANDRAGECKKLSDNSRKAILKAADSIAQIDTGNGDYFK